MRHYFKFLYVAALAVLSAGVYAQQQSSFTNILNNPLQYAPAYAGSTNYHEVGIYNRMQWVGFDGAPRNFYGNFHGSYKNKAKHGYGLQLLSENVGIVSKTGVFLNYGYQLKFNKKWRLGLGVRPGFVQYRMRMYDAVIADEGDYVFTGNTYSTNAFDLSTGFRLYTDTFELIGSVDHMIGNKFNLSSYNQNLQWHYTLMASRKFSAGKNWEIRPAMLMRYTRNIPLQILLTLQGTYRNKLIGGLTLRSTDAFGAFLGWKYNNRLTITYGYDYSYTGIRKYNTGSHEIGIAFVITKNRPSLEEEDDKLNNSILEDIQKEMKNNK